jgi:hypothetical protein
MQCGFRVPIHIALAAAVVAAGTSLAPHAARAGTFEYLSASQRAQLLALPIPVVLPARLPPGYGVVKFEVVNRAAEHSYELRLRAPDGRQMTIDAADSGLGDASPDYHSFRRPFVARSSVVGTIRFEPIQMIGARPEWSWWASASLSPLGSPRTGLNIGGTNDADLKTVYGSLQRLTK